MSIYMIRSKSRGQKRRYKIFLRWMDKIEPFKDTEAEFEDFGVPCGTWLPKPKTSSKIKTAVCKKWLEKTEEIIKKKPQDLPFCKVVAAITFPNIRESRIIIFYDENYYKTFWDRKGSYQIWTPILTKRSFAKERGILTNLPEKGYIEELHDEDWCNKSFIWFYGEWFGSEKIYTKICDECESEFLTASSRMTALCPNCATILYGYKSCKHVFENGKCIKCLWNGNESEYLIKLSEETF